MTKSDLQTSTGPASKTSDKKWFSSLAASSRIWWPVVLLALVLVIAGITKYLLPDAKIYSLMVDLIKAISVIMVVMYVIYTRLLAIETTKMAEASMAIYNSEKGTVTADVIETVAYYNDLPNDARRISKDLHIKDKKLTESEFENLIGEKKVPTISLKIKNRSSRCIDASKIDYQVRHTGCDNPYDVSCDISPIGTINPWADKEIPLIIAPEGEVEVKILSVDYLDNGVVQRVNVTLKKIIERIRIPEK